MNRVRVAAFFCFFLSSVVIGKTWQVNLQQADINVFIRQVAEMTDKSFIVDPRVKGKVTVISNASLDEDAVFRLFLSVLTVHGYAVIESPEGFKVLPQNIAKQGGLNFDNQGVAAGELLVTRVIAIKNAFASELVPILRPLVPQYGHLASVPTVNALIISDHADNIRSLEALIERLDNTVEGEIVVTPLEHAWAGDVISLLQQLIDSSKGQNNRIGGETVMVIADERTNRLVLRGKPGEIAQIQTLIKQLDIPNETTNKTNRLQFVPLQYADAGKVAKLLKDVIIDPATAEANSNKVRIQTNIQADEDLNALLINAEPDVMAEINSVLVSLDVPRAQVLVEAIIAEIRVEDGEEFGIQWLFGDREDYVGGTNFTLGSRQSLNSVFSSSTPSLSAGGTLAFADANIGAIVQALATKTNSNLLSTPKILTLDNQKARILVGETRPFQTGQVSDDSSNAFVTTKRENVGLTLEVTPHINSGGEVRLEVLQKVEAASDEVSDLGTITTVREIETVVIASDGQTIVLGGLIEDDIAEIKQKVPFFGDIPLLGALFRSSSFETTKINLLVFIRPTILRDKLDIDAVTSTQYKGFRAVELQMSGARKGGLDGLFEPELVE
ncbi:type II secretion system protein GspD [Marinomonas agarivorans]|nr:type II secretion system protein GspD [Marinomonas agarivorans]